MDANLQLRIGTGSGTLLSILGTLGMDDILKTILLAAIGATVSFLVTSLLQRWLRKRPK